MSYYLAPSLVKLRDEINKAYPGRDKSSDGWIGDASHAARKSDHNPDYGSGGVVRAIDVDISDIDVNALMALLKRDNRVNYFIYNHAIYGAELFAKRPYTGPNPHTKHIHISIKHTKDAEDGRAWGVGDGNVTPVGDVNPSQPTDYDDLAIDGVIGKRTIRSIQILMTAIGKYDGLIDGLLGPLTWKAVQSWLRDLGYYPASKWVIDGKPGKATISGLQSFLRKKGLYTSGYLIDGDLGPATIKALQKYLSSQNGE